MREKLLKEGRVPFVIGLVPSLGEDGVTVQRRVSMNPHDVILVAEGKATPAMVAEAVSVLMVARSREGLVPVQDSVLRLRISSGAQVHAEYLHSATEWLEMLNNVATREIEGVGAVPHVVVYPRDASHLPFGDPPSSDGTAKS